MPVSIFNFLNVISLTPFFQELYIAVGISGAIHTARKIGFTLNLISFKVEVKYDHSFDPNFDARQMCVKTVIALPIHLILDKEEGKCDLNFDSTFDARKSLSCI